MNQNKNPSQPHDLTCDDYIKILEEKLNGLKQIRQHFKQKKITPGIYEEQTMKSLQQLQQGLDGVRHTFLPLTIPPYLQLSPTPPKWIKLTESQISCYSNFSVENDLNQKEMLRRFRRPGMRRADIQRAALLLSAQQNKALGQMKWKQADFIGNIFIENNRPKINPSDNYSKSLLSEIESYIEGNGLDYPTDDDTLSLLLMALFDEEGPLNLGYPKAKTVQQEVSFISATLCKYATDYPIDKMISYVSPYIAAIHHKQIIDSLAPNVQNITAAIKNAFQILGKDASMVDFGIEAVSSLVVLDGLKESLKDDSPESIIEQLQEIGDEAINSSKSSLTNAAIMIASDLISANMVKFPQVFLFAISWCSGETRDTFKNMPLYILAFNYLMSILDDYSL